MGAARYFVFEQYDGSIHNAEIHVTMRNDS